MLMLVSVSWLAMLAFAASARQPLALAVPVSVHLERTHGCVVTG
jgi:hypothetical protein